jgi:hypothetical protein
MPRWQGSAAERGYGPAHQRERARRLALYRPGDLCAMGGEPLPYPKAVAREWLDLPHDHASGGYLPGLSCRAHNRAEGAARGNKTQPRQIAARGSDVRCKTCGQPYHYAARQCPICGVHYHPTRKIQYTCSRAHGIEYRRRLYGGRMTSKPPRLCGCGMEAQPGWARCAECLKRMRAEAADQALERAWERRYPSVPLAYYHCRYCGRLGITQANRPPLREVCLSKVCQLARNRATKLRLRYGYTAADADAAVTREVKDALASGVDLGIVPRHW